ncbi:MAG: spore cortex-lytic protein [Ruminococcaceae bacterium]|nr:spore cortex-lytic protein [Oscillospiraceae bacterium]
MPEFTIPEYITVHLGAPDEEAENIVVSFIDYIKNVASNEIYPTWPETSLRANIFAQISFALNRIATEWYPSQGYNFDITNSTAYDQSYRQGGDYFENIGNIVDEIFNDYVVLENSVIPYSTKYCDGIRTQCEGLSQWGTVYLANEGYLPYQILQYYYGDDIGIVFDAPVRPNIPSYPGLPLILGTSGEDVRSIQRRLNRIGDNYPSIPKIPVTNGVYNITTRDAVLKFQEIFDLEQTGIVDKSTWYRIYYIYTSVRRLAELTAEVVTREEVERVFPRALQLGDTGRYVQTIQYYLAVIGYSSETIPQVSIDGVFGAETESAVKAFQKEKGLEETGIVDRETWNALVTAYDAARAFLSGQYITAADEIYPGRFISPGVEGDEVRSIQRFINMIAEKDSNISPVTVTGVYDTQTQEQIRKIQAENNLPQTGNIGAITWNTVVRLAKGQQ